MSEPTIVKYRTVYRGIEKYVMASDSYDAAIKRARLQFPGDWKFVRIKSTPKYHIGQIFLLRKTSCTKTISVTVI